MSYDALTISIVITVVIFIIVIIMIGNSKTANDIKMRALARHLVTMQSNKEAMEICREIHEKYPELCAGIDFTLKDESNGVGIDEWNSDKPRPDM
jgi:signal transduction histidine kinase